MKISTISFLIIVVITSLVLGWRYYGQDTPPKTQADNPVENPSASNGFVTTDWIERNTPDFFNVTTTLPSKTNQTQEFTNILDDLLEHGSLENLDNGMIEFLTSKNIPRNEKISTLIHLLSKYENDEIKFLYVLDSLAALKPIEVTDQIVALYKADMSDNKKVHMMTLLEESTYILNPAKQTPEQISYINANIIKIQDFIAQQIDIEQSPLILPSIISTYSRIAPDLQKPQVLSSLIAGQYKNISKDDAGKIAASILMDTPAIQDSAINSILGENTQFNPAVYNRIITELSDESLNIKLSPYAVDAIDSYLNNNGKRIYYQTDGTFDSMAHWLSIKADAKLESFRSNRTVGELLVEKIYEPNSDILVKADILLNADEATRKSILQHTDVTSLALALKDALASPNRIETERSLITDALSVLQAPQSGR